MCVCVCLVRERESERESWRGEMCFLLNFPAVMGAKWSLANSHDADSFGVYQFHSCAPDLDQVKHTLFNPILVFLFI